MSWRSSPAEIIVTAFLPGSLCGCGDGEVDPPASAAPVASKAGTPGAPVKKGERTPGQCCSCSSATTVTTPCRR
jgi:hypothetical protein